MDSYEPLQQRPAQSPWWVWLAAGGLMALVYWDTFQWLIASWTGSPYYSHGFAIVPMAALLGYLRLRRLRASAGPWDVMLGAIIVTCALAIHLIAAQRGMLLISAATFIPLSAGIVLVVVGRAGLLRSAFAIGFLALMLPLPILEQWTPTLARWIAMSVGQTARWLGVQVTVNGARLLLPQADLVIGAPCSGVSSLAALVTLATLYAYLVQGRITARVALVILSIPIALAANWLRIMILVLLAHGLSVDVAMRYFHDWSGLLLFVFALLVMNLFAKALRCQLDFDTLL